MGVSDQKVVTGPSHTAGALVSRSNSGGSTGEGEGDRRRRVYILARKVLLVNTRIFKQSKTLTRAGYSVTVIGILPRGGAEREERDGYTLIRLPLTPLYVTLPRRLRLLRRAFEVWLLKIPGRYVRSAARIRRERRLIVLRLRRRRRLLMFALRRRRRAWRMRRRARRLRIRRAAGDRIRFSLERRHLVILVRPRGRRFRYRVLVPEGLPPLVHRTQRRRRLSRLTWRRRLRRFRYQVGRRRRLLRLRWRRVRARMVRPLRPYWTRLRPYVLALLGSEPPEGSDQLELTRAHKLLGLPLVLSVRGVRGFTSGLRATGRALAHAYAWIRETSLIGRFLRWSVRAEIRLLRATTEFAIDRLARLLRRMAWPLKSIAYYKSVYRFVTQELPPPDVVHANDLDTLLIGVVLARRYKVPLLYDAQELYIGLHTLPWWYRKILAVQEAILVRFTDGITVVNDAIADVMARKYRIHIDSVVLNCPPLEEKPALAAGARTIRERFGLPESEIVLLYSGALGKDRGIENTVLALTRLRQTSLVILGEGGLKPDLERLIEESGLSRRVFFSDFVPHSEVPRFISSADIGVIPYENVGVNHYLCSPSKMFHYIMAELPIACSDFPFLRKVVVENEIGAAFDPSDPESIAAAVRSIINVPGAHAACRSRLKVVKHRYCWEEEEKRLMNVYARLGAKRERGSLTAGAGAG